MYVVPEGLQPSSALHYITLHVSCGKLHGIEQVPSELLCLPLPLLGP